MFLSSLSTRLRMLFGVRRKSRRQTRSFVRSFKQRKVTAESRRMRPRKLTKRFNFAARIDRKVALSGDRENDLNDFDHVSRKKETVMQRTAQAKTCRTEWFLACYKATIPKITRRPQGKNTAKKKKKTHPSLVLWWPIDSNKSTKDCRGLPRTAEDPGPFCSRVESYPCSSELQIGPSYLLVFLGFFIVNNSNRHLKYEFNFFPTTPSISSRKPSAERVFFHKT